MKTCPLCLGQRFVLQFLQPIVPLALPTPCGENMAVGPANKVQLVGCPICGCVGQVPASVAAATSVGEMSQYGAAFATN